MIKNETSSMLACWQLADLARTDAVGDTHLFVLTWMAAGRMVVEGKAGNISKVDELTDLQAWDQLLGAGFPPEAYDRIVRKRSSAAAQDIGQRATAAAIVSKLESELGRHCWDVLPFMCELDGRRGNAEGSVIPELASLLMDMVDAPLDSEVWIPFDFQGQLTIEALRRGWHVLTASPIRSSQLVRELLLTIETGQSQPPAVRDEVERDAVGRPVGRASYALVMPPFAMRIKDSPMSMWDITETRAYEQFSRSESWALFEFANRIDKRAVFVTPHGVLFSKGQEQRLREYLLGRERDTKVKSVITLPPGVFGATNIAGAITIMDSVSVAGAVYMADLGSGRRSLQEAGHIIAAGREAALGHARTDKARLVGCEEIAANEFSFVPSRYLRRLADLGNETVKLGDICEAVRPPVTSKEATPFEVAEVGLPDLHQWQPIEHDIEKTVYLKSAPKDSMLVQPGDIVISIKGSVGRVAVMGTVAQYRPTVVSQSCLVLRLGANWHTKKNLSPEVIVMYLRSPHGRAQLEGLQVGAGVQHISPGTLMSAVMVPLPSEQTYLEIRQDYERLCHLDRQVANFKEEIAHISQRRWPETLE